MRSSHRLTPERRFRRQGLQRRVALRVDTFMLAVQALARGDRVATLPSQVAACSPIPLAELRTPLDLPPFTLDLSYHPDAASRPRHAFLRKALLAYGAASEDCHKLP